MLRNNRYQDGSFYGRVVLMMKNKCWVLSGGKSSENAKNSF